MTPFSGFVMKEVLCYVGYNFIALMNFTQEDLLLRVLNHMGCHDNSIFLFCVRMACIKG